MVSTGSFNKVDSALFLLIDSTMTYDFEQSCKDICTIQNEMQEFVLEEAQKELDRVLDAPRYY